MGTVTGMIQPRRTGSVLALVAHDAKKQALLDLVSEHREILEDFRFVATASTGTRLILEVGLDVEIVESGPNGGDLQIGARVVEGTIDAVIFLRDPLTAHPHEPDIQALMKACDVHDVPIATNLGTAEVMLHFLAERGPGSLRPAGAKRTRATL
jgi:methylglyoxal synthase